MPPPDPSIVERLLSDVLQAEAKKFTENSLPSIDKEGKQYCPEGKVLAYLTISGRIEIAALGLTWSPESLNSKQYIGDGTFRIEFDINADSRCKDIVNKSSIIIKTGPLKLSYPVAEFGATATLKVEIKRVVISAHIRLRECDKEE